MKYVIINESLFNDATALLMYSIFLSAEFKNSVQETYTVYTGTIYTIKVIFISPLIGLAVGAISVALIFLMLDKHNEEYTILRIIIPISATFVSFIIANYVVGVSGIISCIFSGKNIEPTLNSSIITNNHMFL